MIRASTAAVVVGIGAIAAYISYRHALDVATAHGEPGATGRLVPLTVDGLVYVASMVMLDAARRRVQAPALARFALVLGIGATVAVNVLHGVAHGPVGSVIAAWPAITLVVAVELLMGMIRRGHVDPAPAPSPAAPAVASMDEQSVQEDESVTESETEAPAPDPLVATARDRFGETLATGAMPSVRALRRELRIGYPRAVRVREALAAGA
ncbi:DUF2637 domain-containing protein [Actinomadura litoris]|nr:DUF2637 domain-containing protein [Actinomadura litoris]